ncbi:class I SAM-dependent methyltransferase [Sphingomonas sp. So64.6b]|uniref:class I SAM-dependent methyltransferase n=1 Tax=Sphingomonas sp. So64.6b TaxID=2997354 RepID=UPI0016000299|nr:class I SAM-dependent methyltransferase [Sphingomonas sp. So64.6b]QNA84991.1 class I SAM-dependent methyltransferase [Sphingomonas sp. So64.6b]
MRFVLSRLRGRSAGQVLQLIVKNIRHAIAGLSPERRARRIADLAFDRRWGTETSRSVSIHELGIARSRMAQCNRYDPSSAGMLTDPLAALDLDPTAHDFIDYGAGKGRVMMLAMELGFARVTGIELSTRLCEVARANIERFRSQHIGMPAGRVIGADATMFVPSGRDIIAYFYNPFDATVMTVVRHRLESALRHRTGRVVVIYANPEHGAVFDAPGWSHGPSTPGVATFIAGAESFGRQALAA